MGLIIRKFKRKLGRLILLLWLPKKSIGAEVGVWKGGFTKYIKFLVWPAKLHLIDPWLYDENSELYCDSQQRYDSVYDDVCARFKSEISRGKFQLHRDLSHKALSVFDDNYFDWVYVDGDHRYEAVLQDLKICCEKVRVGGYIVGDDYRKSTDAMQGVKRAVDEFVLGGKVIKTLVVNDQFILKKIQ